MFDAGAFVDLKVSGADASDVLVADFYYPSTLTGQLETDLVLLYFNGTAWIPVLSSAGSTPVKNTTDNLGGTVSGGRFAVTFDASSTPTITVLNGTVFSMSILDVTPPAPDIAHLPVIHGQCSASVTTTPTATDDTAGKINGTTSDPLTYTSPGTFIVTWRYDDGHGNFSTQTQKVRVQDTTPPAIQSLKATPNVLWPPNGKMIPVALTVVATDNCDPSPDCRIISVASNELLKRRKDDDGHGKDNPKKPDWEITGPLTLNLRAERQDEDRDRVYTITVRCTDASGNKTTSSVKVRVSHGKQKGAED